MNKNKNYEIILISENKVEVLALIKSKGLAHMTAELFKEVYKNGDIKVIESKKKLKEISKVEYVMNDYKI